MRADEEWKLIRSQRQFTTVMATASILHVMPLFGFIAVAMALIVTPLIEGKARSQIIEASFEGLDFTAWGSIAHHLLRPTPQRAVAIVAGVVHHIR